MRTGICLGDTWTVSVSSFLACSVKIRGLLGSRSALHTNEAVKLAL